SIEATGNQVVLADGSAKIAYEMPESAKSVRIDVLTSSGGLVKTLSGDTSFGVHQMAWDGTDTSGAAVKPGTYQIKVSADSGYATTTVIPVSRTSGVVTGIETVGTDTMLNIGALQVKLSDVLAIRN
ncbi:MAG: FlgD immunoglobulin-like domain containing protein, partial [Rhodospirillaceae bacterium]